MEKIFEVTVLAYDKEFHEYIVVDEDTKEELGMDPFIDHALSFSSPRLYGTFFVKGFIRDLPRRRCIIVSKILSDDYAKAA